MSTIIITEKTSQKRDVQAAIGSKYGQILPAEGHLLSLQEPQQIESSWGRWSFDLLKPDDFYPTCPAPDASPSARSKLEAIAKALKTAERVIIATDCDREGQLIGEEILRHYKFAGQVQRAMFTAQDEKTLRQAFENLEPNDKYHNLGQAAVVRQQADQVYNLSLTRAATVALKHPGQYGAIGIGRVKTPTMAIVCMRELEILDFTPQDYFHLVATAKAETGELDLRHAPKERILDPEKAEKLRIAVEGYEGPLKTEKKIKKTKPPRLLDLPELQKICARRWGWSADKTLNIAQELYDGEGKKIQTYPRAESRYLAENQIDDIGEIIQGLTKLPQYQGIDLSSPEVRKGKSGHFSDAGLKGVSHHAIVPNKNTMDRVESIYGRLTEDEQRMFDLVASSYLAILMPDYVYESTSVSMEVPVTLPDEETGPDKEITKETILDFKVTGNIPKEQGWKAVYTDVMEKKEDHAGELPPIQDGDIAVLSPVTTDTKKTKAPPRYNEGTLIDAMQNAWRFVENKDLKERLKEAKGIGTPATRAAVITGLKLQNFLAQSGKHIIPTQAGLTLYKTLKTAAPELVDPGVTAMWEMNLDDVLEGKQTARQVWDDIGNDTKRLIGIIKTNAATAPKINTGVAMPKNAAKGKPTDKMKETAKSVAQNKGVKLPKGYTSDFNICREFLDEHLGGKEPSPEKVLANLETQLSDGMIKGLGAKAAKQLVESFGPDALKMIVATPEKLKTETSLPKGKVKLLEEWSEERKTLSKIANFLHNHNVDPARSYRLFETLGQDTIPKLKNNPYCIVRNIKGIPFDVPDSIAHSLGLEAHCLERAGAALYYALVQATDAREKNNLLTLLNKRLEIPANILEQALAIEIEAKNIHLYRGKDITGTAQEFLILKQDWLDNTKIKKRLNALSEGIVPWGEIDTQKAIDWVINRDNIELSERQKSAVSKLLKTRFTVLEGLHETGKTDVIKAFVKIVTAKNISTVVAVPSSAQVKTTSFELDVDAISVTRLLEYNTRNRSYKRNTRKPLDCQLLIIDRADLLDRSSLLALLDALSENASLVLVKHHVSTASPDNFFPGTGGILDKLLETINHNKLFLDQLSAKHQDNKLAQNTLKLSIGGSISYTSDTQNPGSFYFITAENEQDTQRKLVEVIKNRLPKSFKYNPVKDIQVISMAAGMLGPQNLTIQLQNVLNTHQPGLDLHKFGTRYKVGDKVILQQNDRDKDLVTGDIGFIKDITRDNIPKISDEKSYMDNGRITIEFAGKNHDFPFGELDIISLAYVLPVNKCQTRLCPATVIILPMEDPDAISSGDKEIASRNNLRQGLSTASERVILIGQGYGATPQSTPQ
ncbi:DNA topoisomerase [Kiloniella sp. EL199]|uniref:DNA topoisomerase n=1 Tax=Kiloniella sp. EL199 TaxID=2107581 RepID=UPI000EA1B70E|nr:DNA topoisomerase [Kiloniella sp. EL199]